MELSYVLGTPYSIGKSRTGGIVSRVLSRSGLELAGARMFAPSRKLVEDFAAVSISETGERHHRRQELLRDYILRTKAPFGTIRREFGETIMVNATHASDSAENAKREMDIAHIAENNLSPLIHAHLS